MDKSNNILNKVSKTRNIIMLWKRYIDDIFIAWKWCIQRLKAHSNYLHSMIKFTYEYSPQLFSMSLYVKVTGSEEQAS